MPIRFRCAYCNQLMGIAKRKAGSVVRCPRCAGEVIVPAEQPQQAAAGPGGFNQLFEDEDFGRDFAEVQPMPESILPSTYGHASLPEPEPRPPAPAPPPVEASQAYNVRRTGIFVTPPVFFGVGALLLVVLCLVFLLGFFLGRATL